ncbi:KEOPS complex subunit Pcc1 [Haladaptatus sp. F3-133]|jgi:tRNA threonylcarbamoyladenosine modification (KEOPS) complex  Pcc1 subunit|uniref:KEOPS complex subunit Pcc1 n=1 Tax=Halorutilus salinus TaxID=2487751 RepID=A0A9Q4C4K0_9EURY|nr:KEOPS complex subunit Pcc1 [Halorutilus salinus]MCX2818890.1 KEOPS complex subunit Pcc1 [Halorutilus salinus]
MSDEEDDRCRLFLEIDDEVARRAIAPETGDLEGAHAELTQEGVVVTAQDPRTLRAALNGWTRLVSVASDDRL